MAGTVMVMAMVLGMVTFFLGQRGTTTVKSQRLVQQLGDQQNLKVNAAELARAEFVFALRSANLSPKDLVIALKCARTGFCPAGPAPGWALSVTTWHTPNGIPPAANIVVKETSESSNTVSQHADITIMSTGPSALFPNPGKPLSVRVNLGQSFASNALTGSSLRCVFCHATVYGNVGEYAAIHNLNIPESTRIHGTWFASGDLAPTVAYSGTGHAVVPTVTTSNEIIHDMQNMVSPLPPVGLPGLPNGNYPNDLSDLGFDFLSPVKADGITPLPPTQSWPAGGVANVFPIAEARNVYMRKLLVNHDGPELPWNPIRQQKSLPKFDPNSALILAHGTVSGSVTTFGIGGGSGPAWAGNSIIEGNALLDGRFSPIVINGNVFFRGDVMIMGTITGKGAIMSGRNIYFPQNVTYLHRPVEFNGSQASNTAMSLVGSAAGANAVLTSIKAQVPARDQVAYYATNNIVIGEPFGADNIDDLVPEDNVYIHRAQLGGYEGLLALDTEYGYVMEPTIVGGTSFCFAKPWENPAAPGVCRNPADPTKVYSLSLNQTAACEALGTPHDECLYRTTIGVPTLPGFRHLFYPENMVNGVMVPWLNRGGYRSITDNYNSFDLNSQTCGMRKVQALTPCTADPYYHVKPKAFVIPLSVTGGTNPYDVTANNYIPWVLKNKLEQQLKLFSILNGQFTARRRYSTGGPLVWNRNSVGTQFWQFLDQLGTEMRGTPSVVNGQNYFPRYPGGLAAGFTRTAATQQDSSARLPWYQGGALFPSAHVVANIHASFNYNSRTKRVFSQITMQGAPPGGILTGNEDTATFICTDFGPPDVTNMVPPGSGNPNYTFVDGNITPCVGGSTVGPAYLAYGAGQPTGAVLPMTAKPSDEGLTVFPDTSATWSTPWWDNRVTNDDDFNFKFMYPTGDLPKAELLTRFFVANDPSKPIAYARNKVSNIDGFLFANQFVALFSDTQADRQIRFNGGIVARDLFGRFVNRIGSERTYVSGQYARAGAANALGLGTGMEGAAPGFILYQDPRFTDSMSFLYSDFGSFSFAE